jgi:hypothetical protein
MHAYSTAVYTNAHCAIQNANKQSASDALSGALRASSSDPFACDWSELGDSIEAALFEHFCNAKPPGNGKSSNGKSSNDTASNGQPSNGAWAGYDAKRQQLLGFFSSKKNAMFVASVVSATITPQQLAIVDTMQLYKNIKPQATAVALSGNKRSVLQAF